MGPTTKWFARRPPGPPPGCSPWATIDSTTCTSVLPAVRPLKVRDGRLRQRRDHERKFMAAIGTVPLKGTQEARSTVAVRLLRAFWSSSIAARQSSSEHWKVSLSLSMLRYPPRSKEPRKPNSPWRRARTSFRSSSSVGLLRLPPPFPWCAERPRPWALARGARNRRRGSHILHGAPDGRHPWVLARGARNRRRGSRILGRDGHRRHPSGCRPIA